MATYSFQDFMRKSGAATPEQIRSIGVNVPVQKQEEQKGVLSTALGEIGDAATAGVNKIGEGLTQTVSDPGKNPFNATQGIIKAGAGAVEALTSPLAPVINHTVKPIVDYAVDKISDVPLVQKAATAVPEGGVLDNVLSTTSDLGEIAGGVLGAKGIPTATQAIKSGISSTAKAIPEAIKNPLDFATKLKNDTVTFLGESSATPHLKSSATRAIETKKFDPLSFYEEYFPKAKQAITDIKADTPISSVGEKIGDAFKQVVAQRKSVGSIMGEEIKKYGNKTADIEPMFTNFETLLNDNGLTYNGLTKKLVSSDLTKVAAEDVSMISDFIKELNKIGTNPTIAQIDALISRTASKIDYDKSARGMTSVTNGERILNSALGQLRETFTKDPELGTYAQARKIYGDLSNFIDEGGSYLGKITQSGDFAKDASLAKSAVQSILNNGKKDWLMRLEGLTDYPALDDAVIALQAMKDAGDFRGLSLLQTMSEGAVPMSKSGIIQKVLDYGLDKGARVVLGESEARTKSFLQSLRNQRGNAIEINTKAQSVAKPATGEKTTPITKQMNKSNKDIKGKVAPTKKKAIEKKTADIVEEAQKADSPEEFIDSVKDELTDIWKEANK